MNIAILGYGTIGKGVFEIVNNRSDITVLKILERPERVDEKYKDLFVSSIEEIVKDENIDLVVEVLAVTTYFLLYMAFVIQFLAKS